MKRRKFLKNTFGVGAITAASSLSAPAIAKGKMSAAYWANKVKW